MRSTLVRHREPGVEEDARRPEQVPAPQPDPRLASLPLAAGNAAVSRRMSQARLARLKKEHEAGYEEVSGFLWNLKRHRELLYATAANWNDYNAPVQYLNVELNNRVDPKITKVVDLMAEVDAEHADSDAKLKEAKDTALEAKKELIAITKDGREEMTKKINDQLGGEVAAFKEKRAKEASAKKAAEVVAQAQAKALADAQKLKADLDALGVAPSAAGPAFTRPGPRQLRDDLHEWVTKSWAEFRNLPRTAINNPNCPLYVLTKAQIDDLRAYLNGRVPTEWGFQGWPTATRTMAGNLATFPGMIMPTMISGVSAKLGAEITVDWLQFNAGHSAPAERLAACWQMTGDPATFKSYGGDMDVKGDRTEYRFPTGKRLIVKGNRETILTYYDGK